MRTMSLRAGVAGCGRVARGLHLPNLARLPGIEVVALAEPDSQWLAQARRFAPRAQVFCDYQEMLSTAPLDAVIICLPSSLHADAAVAALNAGKHIYLEKPLATSAADAQRVLTAWLHANTIGMIGFNYRFNPLYRKLERAIGSGRIGEWIGARSVFSVGDSPPPRWQQRRAEGGGVLLDLGSHHFDLMRFFFKSPIREVFATVQSNHFEDDSASTQLRLANGLTVQSMFARGGVEEDRFEVEGRSGRLLVRRHMSLDVEIFDTSLKGARFKQAARLIRTIPRAGYILEKAQSPGFEPSHRAALEQFARAVQTGQPASPDLVDGFISLAVVLAAEESNRIGAAVPVAEW